jgi:uncharacterized protein (DUF2384 family)
VPPLPVDRYRELARFFPTLSDRSRALGLSRETLTRWERDPDTANVRHATARALETLARVTEDAEELVGDARAAGTWMLAPQPALNGATAAALARQGTDASLAAIARLMLSETPPLPPAVPRGRIMRRPATVAYRRTRPRDPVKAELLRELGVEEAAVGPARER